MEEKLREEFRKLGPTSDNYARWKKKVLEDGTLKKSLGIHGGDIVSVTKEVRKVETEKVLVNFPVDVSFSLFLRKEEKSPKLQKNSLCISLPVHLEFFENFKQTDKQKFRKIITR